MLWQEAAPDAEPFTTYNLEVEGAHTFFVGAEGVWVHNLCSAAVESWASRFEALLTKHGGDFQKANEDVLKLMRQIALTMDDYDAVGEYINLRRINLIFLRKRGQGRCGFVGS